MTFKVDARPSLEVFVNGGGGFTFKSDILADDDFIVVHWSDVPALIKYLQDNLADAEQAAKDFSSKQQEQPG